MIAKDSLAEYLSAEEHVMHAQFAQLVAQFHLYRARAIRTRETNEDVANSLDADAEKMAKLIDSIEKGSD